MKPGFEHTKKSTNSTTGALKPKMFIISMFEPEAEVWYGIPEFNLLALNISLPGLSPRYSDVHCTVDGEVCQLTIGESEINAASSVLAVALSAKFNLTATYWMVAGIAGINPEIASTGSVTFARFAVQVGLQYEFDMRELPANFTTGYVPLGVTSPDQYPKSIYGTEVFEVNTALQDIAIAYAKTASLNDSADAIAYRANYMKDDIYAAGAASPGVYACDVATSDVYFSGRLLGEAFSNYTRLMTNGTGIYCTAAQEDNATLEVLLRAAIAGLVDFSRIIVMRTASDYDRQFPGEEAYFNLFYANQGSFLPAVKNLYLAGIKVVNGVLGEWDTKFAKGIPAPNYIGDIFGSLGGTPDFGPFASSDNPVVVGRELNYGDGRRNIRNHRREGAGIKARVIGGA
ncbi:purine nucleoside permease-domain-containing protein [Crepidotus variabilis]|uniref:Purine nucleoside permease-domain-containing protein n=1 Tax=Crepidotus variabilis TaxID=179855 RepID=A0A9P6ENS1_9AGAR|nr:purine nucleoside permease-domain-containing protein [Crepidotus variabilis]